MRRARRENERGFALLLVFAMAAAVGVMLYLEMPRVAFEHQRNKEGLLAERGEQYIRAIQLFYKKTNKYPQTIEDLESTNNIRFLRRRYKDPMTGEEEWRLIHVDSAGQFVDSLIHKKADEKKESGPSALSSNIIGIGASAEYVPQAGEKTGAATVRRASDRIIPGMGGAVQPGGQSAPEEGTEGDQPRSDAPPAQPNGPPLAPPGTNPLQPVQPLQPGQGQVQRPGFPQQGVGSQQGGQFGQPVGPTPPASSTSPAQPGGGFGFGGGFGSGSSSGSGSGSGSSSPALTSGGQNQSQRQPGGFPGSSQSSGAFGQGFGGGGFGGGNRATQGTSNQAVQAIQNMLTNPRQGGMGTGGGSASGGPTQGGIVGVASKKDMEGIRLYNERSNYKEWEFLFDRKKAMEAAGVAGQPGQQGQQGTGPNGTQGPGQTSGTNPFSSFGGSGNQQRPAPGGFGGSGSSGSSSGGFGSSSFGKGN
ncbi:MAG TPA: hypothetical protein VGK29_18025 [Paludibaculum sp.]|jgi:hypothetical protein